MMIGWIFSANNWKIVIIFLLFSSIFLSSKNSMAARHNILIIQNRVNSLSVFQDLIQASGDEQTREVLLHYASSSIFSHQDTGLIRGKSSTLDGTLEGVLKKRMQSG